MPDYLTIVPNGYIYEEKSDEVLYNSRKILHLRTYQMCTATLLSKLKLRLGDFYPYVQRHLLLALGL